MKSAIRTSVFGLSLMLAGTGSVLACWAPPQNQLIDVDAQIALATDVVVAKVVSAVPAGPMDTDYTFVVQERLAGPARPLFTLTGSPHRDGDKEGDYDRHTSAQFWERGGGRTMNGGDCIIHPSFEVGATYLVFAAPPYTWRSFERIEATGGRPGPEDKWLAYVRSKLRAVRAAE